MLCSIFVFACLGYVALLFGCHMINCWQHPPVKPIAAAVEPLPPLLLLPPAAEFSDFSDGCFSSRKIAVVEPPAKDVQIAPTLAIDPAADLPANPPERPAGEAIDPAGLTSAELRKLCSDRGIRWRGVKAGKHLSKPEMIAALS